MKKSINSQKCDRHVTDSDRHGAIAVTGRESCSLLALGGDHSALLLCTLQAVLGG